MKETTFEKLQAMTPEQRAILYKNPGEASFSRRTGNLGPYRRKWIGT
jgi:hypothetical protein